jgi:hypothetical protein
MIFCVLQAHVTANVCLLGAAVCCLLAFLHAVQNFVLYRERHHWPLLISLSNLILLGV